MTTPDSLAGQSVRSADPGVTFEARLAGMQAAVAPTKSRATVPATNETLYGYVPPFRS